MSSKTPKRRKSIHAHPVELVEQPLPSENEPVKKRKNESKSGNGSHISLQKRLDQECESRRHAEQARDDAEVARDNAKAKQGIAMTQLREGREEIDQLRQRLRQVEGEQHVAREEGDDLRAERDVSQENLEEAERELKTVRNECEMAIQERDEAKKELYQLNQSVEGDNQNQFITLYAITNQNINNINLLHSLVANATPDFERVAPNGTKAPTIKQVHARLQELKEGFDSALDTHRKLSAKVTENGILNFEKATKETSEKLPFLKASTRSEDSDHLASELAAPWFQGKSKTDLIYPASLSLTETGLLCPQALREQKMIAWGVLEPSARAAGLNMWDHGKTGTEGDGEILPVVHAIDPIVLDLEDEIM
ncbi:hypothetical protein CC80DRAFT_553567 [Byssothecium circinans]|uniref:Uncharacterized protein n=1 Tax=Byssothecium circinans TaxID=147558 RepID=A0A6A5TG91_9PLEO|nr:hypothetical protein CC80DRAFT_553567 [Byssothecium circinans]